MKASFYLAIITLTVFASNGKLSGSEWADSVLATLSLEQKVGQMVFPALRPGEDSVEVDVWVEAEELVRKHFVGGFALFGGTYPQVMEKLAKLQNSSPVFLLIASDFERGAGQKIGGATVFPPNMALGAAESDELSYRVGLITGLQARQIGVHMTFSPVMDVNNNPANPIINVRSFGEDPKAVSSLGTSYIRGCRDGGILTTAKHFPGHGDTGIDSHTGLPVIGASREEFEKIELVPFESAIEFGVDAIMVGHLSVPSLDVTGTPASISHTIIEGLLRKDLRFGGLVVTDALIMDAIKHGRDAGSICRQALEAGADILLMPEDVSLCLKTIIESVRNGALEERSIDESVRRILEAKERVIFDMPMVKGYSSGKGMGELIADGRQVARELAKRSVTLLSNRGNLIPVEGRFEEVFSVTVRGDTLLPDASPFHDVMRESLGNGYRFLSIQPDTDSLIVSQAIRKALRADLLIVTIVSQVRAYKGYPGLPRELVELVRRMLSNRRSVLLSFGNPYIISSFPAAPSILLSYGTDRSSQRAAARALLGKAPISGRTPVAIPGGYKVGTGIILEGRGTDR